MLELLNKFYIRLYLAAPRNSKLPPSEVFVRTHGGALCVRSHNSSRTARVNSVFSLDRTTLTVTRFTGRCVRRGYKIDQYRCPFDRIKFLQLEGETDSESGRQYWRIVISFTDRRRDFLIFDTEDFSGCEEAITRICEATGIARG
jgi:hypothetical protein